MLRNVLFFAASLSASLPLASCSAPVGDARLIDPDAFGSDLGTLISIADLRAVSQEMIQSMNESEALSELRRDPPVWIELGPVRQFTTVTNFDKRLFVNRLVAELQKAAGDGSIRFLLPPEDVPAEAAVPAPAPDLVLDGEVREILSTRPLGEGGEVRTRTIQYALRLVRPGGGEIVWAHTHEIVKSQVIGAVYR